MFVYFVSHGYNAYTKIRNTVNQRFFATNVDPYPIIEVQDDAKEDTEQLGSKPKFWISLESERWLYKSTRPGTGEDWTEKVAAEIAAFLDISAAEVNLATFRGQRGSLSRNFVNVASGEALVHGNEILPLHVTEYDSEKIFSQSDHTIQNIVRSVKNITEFLGGDDLQILRDLASYMVLDAVIGNTDRHHENWGLLYKLDADGENLLLRASPSFDHASSLGRELSAEKAHQIISENRVESYVRRARGGIYRGSGDKKGENPLELALVAAKFCPDFFQPALSKIPRLTDDVIESLVDRVPNSLAAKTSKDFAKIMIRFSRNKLMKV